jgi:hypothetical protein
MSSKLFYKIQPMKSAFLKRVRSVGVDDQAQLVEHLIARGGEPCRDSLQRARAGEALILASYCPFEIAGPYREYGPVFLRTEETLVVVPQRLSDLVDAQYLGQQFVLRAYSSQERIVDACLTSPAQCEIDARRLFELKDVQFILVRFPTYGCYACRIERI